MSTEVPSRCIKTRSGDIAFPAYVPVTTFGKKYPLDDLIRPYLPRLAPAVMVSYHYARQKNVPLRVPMLVDSGGFASLFEKASVEEEAGLGVIRTETEGGAEYVRPHEVLEFQEQHADIAFTLDFPIPPGTADAEAERRQTFTIANAIWAIDNRRRRDLPLYAVAQGWDEPSFVDCAEKLLRYPFEGLAIGGLVPRAHDEALVLRIVERIRQLDSHRPIHVFGLGRPALYRKLIAAGADSVDSSSYVKLAADGRAWGGAGQSSAVLTPSDRMRLALANLAYATGRTLPLGFVQQSSDRTATKPA